MTVIHYFLKTSVLPGIISGFRLIFKLILITKLVYHKSASVTKIPVRFLRRSRCHFKKRFRNNLVTHKA